jgi:hypothetical protein
MSGLRRFAKHRALTYLEFLEFFLLFLKLVQAFLDVFQQLVDL